jgi:hypothetical protein
MVSVLPVTSAGLPSTRLRHRLPLFRGPRFSASNHSVAHYFYAVFAHRNPMLPVDESRLFELLAATR